MDKNMTVFMAREMYRESGVATVCADGSAVKSVVEDKKEEKAEYFGE